MHATGSRGQELVLLAERASKREAQSSSRAQQVEFRMGCWSRKFDARQPAYGLREMLSQTQTQDDRKSHGRSHEASRDVFENGRLEVPFPVPETVKPRNISVLLKSADLLWKPTAAMVRSILVDHPTRGQIILLSTDVSMEAYGQRILLDSSCVSKIKVAFKHAMQSRQAPAERGTPGWPLCDR